MAFFPLQLEGQSQINTQQNCSLLLCSDLLGPTYISWRWLSCFRKPNQTNKPTKKKQPEPAKQIKSQTKKGTCKQQHHRSSFKGIAHYFVAHSLLPPTVKVKKQNLFVSPSSVTLAKANTGSLGNESSVYLVQVMSLYSFSSVHTLDESPNLALYRLPLGMSIPIRNTSSDHTAAAAGQATIWVMQMPAHEGLVADVPHLSLWVQALVRIHKQLILGQKLKFSYCKSFLPWIRWS